MKKNIILPKESVLLTLLIITLLNTGLMYSQTTFNKRYNYVNQGTELDGITKGLDGKILLAGLDSLQSANRNWCLVKVDTLGNVVSGWQYKFGTSAFNCKVKSTSDSGYIAYGLSSINDAVLIKINKSGNIQWSKKFVGTASDLADVVELNGSFIVTAPSQVGYGMVKVSSTGNIIWSKIYPGSTGFQSVRIVYTSDNYLVLTGTAPAFTTQDICVTKTDTNGTIIWTKSFHDGNNTTYPLSICQTTDLGFVVLCWVNGPVYALKLDLNGNFSWFKYTAGTASSGYRILDVVALPANETMYLRVNTTSFVPPCHVYMDKLSSTGTTYTSYSITAANSDPYYQGQILRNKDGSLPSGPIYAGSSWRTTSSVAQMELIKLKSSIIGCSTLSQTPNTSPLSTAPLQISGVGFGTYNATLTTISPTFMVIPITTTTLCSQSPLSVTSTQTNVLCNGQCTGIATAFPSGGTGPYTYSWSPGGQTTATKNNMCAGTYTCVVKDAALSSMTINLTITQPSAISSTISTTSTSICSGNCSTLTATSSGGTGAITFTWQPGSIANSSIAACPTINTTYTLTSKDANNCTFTNTSLISVSANPTITVNSGSICSGSSFTMTPSGASSYTYSGGSAVVSPTSNASYSVSGTSTAGCVSSSPAVSNVTVITNPIANAGSSQTITCISPNVNLNGSGVTTYTWSGPGIVSGGNTASPNVNASGTYSLVGSTSGCVSTNTATVTVSTNTVAPSVGITASSNSICIGNSATLTANSAGSYTWSTGSTNTTIIVNPTTSVTYTVTGTNSTNGCTGTITKSIGVNPLPTVIANTSASIICGPPFQGTATITSGGAATYTWNTSATTVSISVSPSVTTNYTVTGTDANGCMNTASFTQSVSACTGIQPFGGESSEFVVYPNPTSKSITIKAKAGLPLNIYNILGELILSSELKTDRIEIDLSNQPNGIYFIRIEPVTMKIIKE